MAKILVVDDEEMVRDLFTTILKRLSHDPIMAAYGKQAIEMYRKELPTVVILDLHLPDMPGLEVLRAIRDLDPKASIIIWTGAGTEGLAEARALGVSYFLRKGFSLHQIAEALRHEVDKKSAWAVS